MVLTNLVHGVYSLLPPGPAPSAQQGAHSQHSNPAHALLSCNLVRPPVLQVRGDELVAVLRRQSRGPTSTTSSFRGVTKHAKGK